MANFSVGTVQSPSSTGTEAITGLGFTPSAIIFVTSGSNKGANTWSANIYQGFGFTSGPGDSLAVASTSDSQVATSNTKRRLSLSKAITSITPAGSVQWEAELSSFDADGFTLNWTLAGLSGVDIMYLAIGGVNAQTVWWSSPTADGNRSVAGVGFQPDIVFHATHGQSSTGNDDHGTFSLGAMDSAGNQWTAAVNSEDNLATSDTAHYQRTDKAISWLSIFKIVAEEAEYTSMDADGFSMNYTNASTAAALNISLCIEGVKAKVGSFTLDQISKSVTGVGFTPEAILTANTYDALNTSSGTAGTYLGMGLTDTVNYRTVNQSDFNNVETMNAQSIWEQTGLFKAKTSSFEAWDLDVTSYDADGFTVDNTGTDTFGFMYVALASVPNDPPNAPTLDSPQNSAAIDVATDVTFQWTFSDPDIGNTQSAYALRRKQTP